ncbi:hypothetical protein FY036_01860 [Mesorhizobium microcysteis]|uniref:Uncharacterized protein n=1 Tax=Neoaquamicrobium microcysteis TaxID=2682781 RepID=A0A5D4H6I8_9HYPH|nr:hypothetical protein [Mesorhizobium microcysteis]TYR35639.1 hypothetical protein FY036_01860 [Mesorhizobium microcysteis]
MTEPTVSCRFEHSMCGKQAKEPPKPFRQGSLASRSSECRNINGLVVEMVRYTQICHHLQCTRH